MTVLATLRPRSIGSPPPLSPPRGALAAAIETHRQRREEAAAVDAAVAAARTAWRAAEDRRTEAAAGVETAKHAAVEYLTREALGTAGPPPKSVAAARRELVDAEDAAEAATEVMTALDKRRDALPALFWTADKLTAAAAAVLRASPEVAALVDDVNRLQREMVRKGTVLLLLATHDAIDKTRVETPLGAEHSAAMAAVHRLQSPMATWQELLKDPALDGAAPWREALAALEIAATAPLPSVEHKP